MSFVPLKNQVYGLPTPLSVGNPITIVANRAPTTRDFAQIGQIWVYSAGNTSYMLVSIVSNVATWNPLAAASGAGVFTSLTVTPGPISLTGTTSINTSGAANTSIGTGTNTGVVAIGSGNSTSVLITAPILTLDGPAPAVIGIGASLTTGTITIGGTAETGTLTLGSSSAAQTTIVGGGAGISTVQIANGTAGNLIQVGNGANTVAQLIQIAGGASAANSTVSILSGNGSAGVQTFNAVTGTRAGVVNIGTGAAAHSVTIGSTTAGAATSIRASSTGGLSLNAAGNLTAPPAVVSAAAYAATLNAQFGQVTLTGQVLASAGVQVLTITNSLCTTSTPILLTVDNLGSNDAQLTVQRIQLQAGSFLVTVKNNGAAALNGDIHVTFWLLQ